MEPGLGWHIKYLYELGVLGPGKKIESYPLPMDQWDKLTFRKIFCDAIARKVGIGADLAAAFNILSPWIPPICFQAWNPWPFAAGWPNKIRGVSGNGVSGNVDSAETYDTVSRRGVLVPQ